MNDGITSETNSEASAAAAAANQLATRFSDARDAFISLAGSCTPEQWQAMCPDEGWTVGASARHVAGGMLFHAGHITRMARGRPIVQVTMEQIDEANRENEGAVPEQAETVEALRVNGERLAGVIRGLTDEQLALSQPIPFFNEGQVLTTAEMIENVAIWHVEAHHESVRAAMGNSA